MIYGVWGKVKSTKSTLGLTFPKPMAYLEFDIGGYERAARYLTKQGKLDADQVDHKLYPMPMQEGATRGIKVDPKVPLSGYAELYYQFLKDFEAACHDPKVATITVDTGSQYYELVRLAYLQELQEKQLEGWKSAKKDTGELRTSLQAIEYAEPYARMRSQVYLAKGSGKELVMVNHAKDVYVQQVNDKGKLESVQNGDIVQGGWAKYHEECDIVIHTWVEMTPTECIPHAKIDPTVPCGHMLELTGVNLPEPSYDGLMQLMEIYK